MMVNTRKGKVTGAKKGKGDSNRGGSSSSGSVRSGSDSATDGRENEDVLMDAEEDVGVDEETRLLEEEAERMRERLRSMRGSMSGTRENQEQRERSVRVRRTDGNTERRVVLERSRSPPVRSRQRSGHQEKEEELAAMRRQVERLASKVTHLGRGKKWKHKGNEKQYQFTVEVRGIVVEDL